MSPMRLVFRHGFFRLCLALIAFSMLPVCPRAQGQDTSAVPLPPEAPSTPAAESQGPADGHQRDAQARAEFRAGKQAYDAADFRSAWRHFREAYLLSERPELLYNIGQAADRMEMKEQALAAFEMYLGSLPNAENAEEVRQRIAALRGKVPEVPPEAPADAPADQHAVDDEAAEAAQPTSDDGHSSNTAAIRSGMLIRAGVGLGLYLGSWNVDQDTKGSIRGFGLGLDLVGAYTILPKFLVGGTLLLNYQPSPTFRQGSDQTEPMDGQTLWALGPTALYYLDPEDNGGYVQLSLVLSGTTKARQDGAVGAPAGVAKATGGGVVLGGGYEIPYEGAFAYGIGGRVSLARLGEGDVSHTAVAIAVTGTVTWY